jgi:hypothetical protein
MKRTILIVVILVTVVHPLRAQWVVIDPANLAQAVLIAERTLREYQTLVAQYLTIIRMAEGLGSLDGYRIPGIGTTRHDAGRWEFGRAWLEGLNGGDPDGSAYARTARRVEPPGGLLRQLPPSARRAVEQAYATVEITDSVATLGGHQVALVRGYTGDIQRAISALEDDVMSGLLRYHEMTAILDKIAGGELIGRRQDTATNQLLAHALEQLLARSKRLRDTEAATMNMRLGGMRDGAIASAALVRDASSDLRSWRQP